jgi:hypothetical protein
VIGAEDADVLACLAAALLLAVWFLCAVGAVTLA